MTTNLQTIEEIEGTPNRAEKFDFNKTQQFMTTENVRPITTHRKSVFSMTQSEL